MNIFSNYLLLIKLIYNWCQERRKTTEKKVLTRLISLHLDKFLQWWVMHPKWMILACCCQKLKNLEERQKQHKSYKVKKVTSKFTLTTTKTVRVISNPSPLEKVLSLWIPTTSKQIVPLDFQFRLKEVSSFKSSKEVTITTLWWS